MKRIEIEIQSGLIEVMKLPKGVQLLVRDYDTDGCDPDTEGMKKDKEGNLYFENIYG